MILKKILSFAASIIKLFILIFFTTNLNSEEKNSKYYNEDLGTLAIMYHRFEENEYPSTNVKIDIFKKQVALIEKKNLLFYNLDDFDSNFNKPKNDKKILLTIDDAFTSFYEHAWPYLNENKIPFILFVSTQHVGKYGYMSWEQIKEIEKENFAFIGNHSHSHEYLINYDFDKFKEDIDTSIKVFKNNLGYNPKFFLKIFIDFNISFLNLSISNSNKYSCE